MQIQSIPAIFSALSLCIFGCGDSSNTMTATTTDNEKIEGEGGITGDVTLSGTLTLTSPNTSRPIGSRGYKALILDTATGAQKIVTVDANEAFSAMVAARSSYMINFMTDEYNYIGTMVTDSVKDDNSVPIALSTGPAETMHDLGVVTANTTTGRVTPDRTLEADETHMAYTSGGVVAGGRTGEGNENYESTQEAVTDTIADADDPDDDNDGVPDIFDTDNNNNGYADEVDGHTDKCVPGTVALYIENYTTAADAAQPGFPTPFEIDADLGGMTMYQVHLEFTPAKGVTVDDISEIVVTAPSYIESYGYVYHVKDTHECFQTLWTDCNGKKLMLTEEATKFEVAVADSDPGMLQSARLLENMLPGDTFVFNITMADGTTHTCTRKINIIPKYFPYAFKKDGADLDANVTVYTGWDGDIHLSWSIPEQLPAGLNYEVRLFPYDTCMSWDPENPITMFAGQDATAITIQQADLPTSGVNGGWWSMSLWFTDSAGDQSHTGMINFTNASTNPCKME